MDFFCFKLDHLEIFSPMAKSLAYWHCHALGFSLIARKTYEEGAVGLSSYVLQSNNIKLVITSVYPPHRKENVEVENFISGNYCGVKKIAIHTSNVKNAFFKSLENGAIPKDFPLILEDQHGYVEQASLKLLDNNEIVFINRDFYNGVFIPGFVEVHDQNFISSHLQTIDHIASEVRINESSLWATYIGNALKLQVTQNIDPGEENSIGMKMKICQSEDYNLTFVLSEPDNLLSSSKIQMNIDNYGVGIHHIAFATNNIVETVRAMNSKGVEFVKFPSSYYELLRQDPNFSGLDIDLLEEVNILCDVEGDQLLFQKFLKPITDRPYFLYEIIQRSNGYRGFALNNINVLKKAEETQLMK